MNNRLRDSLNDLFSAGVDPHEVDPHTYLKVQTTSAALMVGVVASFAFGGFYAAFSPLLSWLHYANGAFYLMAYIYFRYRTDFAAVTRACCSAAVVVTWIVSWTFGGVVSPVVAWFILPAIASSLILGGRDGWFWIVVGCIGATALLLLEQLGVLPANSIPTVHQSTAFYLYCLSLALVVAVLFSFWIARQRVLEAQLNVTVAQSKRDAYLAGLLADSAAIANGSLAFERACPACLSLLCEANGWGAGHIWHVTSEHGLLSSGIWQFSENSEWSELAARTDDLSGAADVISAAISAKTVAPILDLDLATDPRFAEPLPNGPVCTLSWPVEVGGRVELVLEFFSRIPITLDDELKTLLGHVAVQLSHVRMRQIERERAEKLAFIDHVTGLPNRAGFEHLCAQKLKDAKRRQSCVAMMFVDLDGFKRVNDSLGHAVGDRLLKTVGERLEQHVRPSDITAKLDQGLGALAARLGGDEFTLVLCDLDDADGAATVARRFLDMLSTPIDVGFQEVNIGASIGIALYPDDGQTVSDLMRMADAAMYEAKARPGNQYCFATAALNDTIQRRLWIESELHRAIRSDELRLEFVPIVASTSGRIISNEVSLRWPHRDGEIPFTEFFAVAESSNLVCELGLWTIEKACAAIAEHRWSSRNNIRISLDISLLLLQQPNFVDNVSEILRRYDCPDGVLEFEFSETGAILKHEECRKNVRRLHDLGIRIVLDRFGTGYSSLVDLSELPVWRIKLDRKFVEAVNVADGNRSMGRAIIAMAHSMGVETTIFNVATAAQAQWLREMGCDAMQGGWVGRAAKVPNQCRVHALTDGTHGEPVSIDSPA